MMYRQTMFRWCWPMIGVWLIPAIAAPLPAAEEHCCREVTWGTVTVAVHDGRLITTGVDPQHPSAVALDKVLGDDASEPSGGDPAGLLSRISRARVSSRLMLKGFSRKWMPS